MDRLLGIEDNSDKRLNRQEGRQIKSILTFLPFFAFMSRLIQFAVFCVLHGAVKYLLFKSDGFSSGSAVLCTALARPKCNFTKSDWVSKV